MYKTIAAFEAMDSEKELKKNKLTLADYFILSLVLKEIIESGESMTFVKSVVDWCNRNGLSASLSEDGINYVIKKKGTE